MSESLHPTNDLDAIQGLAESFEKEQDPVTDGYSGNPPVGKEENAEREKHNFRMFVDGYMNTKPNITPKGELPGDSADDTIEGVEGIPAMTDKLPPDVTMAWRVEDVEKALKEASSES